MKAVKRATDFKTKRRVETCQPLTVIENLIPMSSMPSRHDLVVLGRDTECQDARTYNRQSTAEGHSIYARGHQPPPLLCSEETSSHGRGCSCRRSRTVRVFPIPEHPPANSVCGDSILGVVFGTMARPGGDGLGVRPKPYAGLSG